LYSRDDDDGRRFLNCEPRFFCGDFGQQAGL
jgi:hypothetical protein